MSVGPLPPPLSPNLYLLSLYRRSLTPASADETGRTEGLPALGRTGNLSSPAVSPRLHGATPFLQIRSASPVMVENPVGSRWRCDAGEDHGWLSSSAAGGGNDHFDRFRPRGIRTLRLQIELLAGEISMEEGVMLKWKADFRSTLGSCVILSASSAGKGGARQLHPHRHPPPTSRAMLLCTPRWEEGIRTGEGEERENRGDEG